MSSLLREDDLQPNMLVAIHSLVVTIPPVTAGAEYLQSSEYQTAKSVDGPMTIPHMGVPLRVVDLNLPYIAVCTAVPAPGSVEKHYMLDVRRLNLMKINESFVHAISTALGSSPSSLPPGRTDVFAGAIGDKPIHP